MKWKIGAVLMFIVFCLAIVPAAVSGFNAGGLDGIFASANQLVLQLGNNKAMLNDQKVSFGNDNRTSIYSDGQGDLLLPIAATSEVMGMQIQWDGTTPEASIVGNEKSIEVGVVYRENADIETPVFMSAKEFAKKMGLTYSLSKNGYFAVLSDEETSDKTMSKLCDKATELLGYPEDMLLKSSFIFRAGSSKVIKGGEQVELVDSENKKYSPIIEKDLYYFPTRGIASVLGGNFESDKDRNILKIGDKTIEVSKDGAKLNGKTNKNINVLLKDDELYISAQSLADIMKYNNTGEGDIFIMGELSYKNAQTQVQNLTALGNDLPDKGLDVPKADAYVALTFDDGPTGGVSGLTARLLDGLKERNAKATFFMCGYRIKDFNKHMNRYLDEGHALANHTMDHPKGFPNKTYDEIVYQIQSNSELIKSYCGEGPMAFRPVGGFINDNVKRAAEACGLPIINWSVDTEDWKYRDAERIKNVIVQNVKDGDIVLMHDLRECTLEGVLKAIDILSENGFAFVTVEQLAQLKGVELKAGQVYTDFRAGTVKKLLGTQ